MLPITVLPSLPAASFEEIKALAEALCGIVSELQIDIVDGTFVPATSWPFTEVGTEPGSELEKLSTLMDMFSIEMDCMVCEPEQYLDLFVDLGVSRVIVHMRSTTAYDTIIAHAAKHEYALGLAFTNDVPYAEYEPYLVHCDFVQVMGIASVGAQGMPFDTRTLETVQCLRTKHPDLEIAVDGSVNKETIVPLKAAGANRFAPGSAIAKQPDPAAAYHQLCALVSSAHIDTM